MKKLFLIPLLVFSAVGADYDLRKGVDLTSVTGGPTYSQLNQLVDAGLIATNKGLIFITQGNTNPTATPFGRTDMTNFVWRDTSNTPPVLRVWNAAASTWDTASLAPGSVTTSIINDGAVTTAKLAANAVETAKIGDNQVITAKIPDGAITTAKILDANVTSNKLGNRTIVATNIALAAITSAEIATNQIGSNWITADAINGTKILDRSIGNTDILTNSISSNEIAHSTITLSNLVTSIRTNQIFAWGKVGVNGVNLMMYNCTAVTNLNTCVVTFGQNASSTNYVVVTSVDAGTAGTTMGASVTNIQSVSTFTIHSYLGTTGAGVPASNYFFQVYGGY